MAMKPVSDSTSQPLHRNDSVSQRNIAPNRAEKDHSNNRVSSKIESNDHLLERALSAVKANDDIVDHAKVASLKDKIQNGDYAALSSDSAEYWDNLANKMIEAEHVYSK